jgi:methyl-accepting chemotaxis protein
MLSFKRMGVSARLLAAGVAVVLGLIMIAGYSLLKLRSDALAAHSVRIKDVVEVSKGVIANYQKLETGGLLNREEAQEQAKEALRGLRYSHDDYFFLHDFSGRALMVAGNPKIEGQVLLGKTDAAGFKLWDAIVSQGKSGQGYFDYVFPRAGQSESTPKRGYVIGIPEWQWIVGSGVYIDDVDQAVNQAALHYGLLSLLALTLVAGVSYLVSRSIVTQLGGEPYLAAESMQKIANGDLGITIVVNKNDSTSLMASLKLMQMKLKNITSSIQDNAQSLNSQVTSFEEIAKSYSETKSEEELTALVKSIDLLGKTASMLERSISRFKL